MYRDFNYSLVSLPRVVRKLVKAMAKDYPLTFEQIRVIAYIQKYPELNQVDLAQLMEIKTMSASKLVNSLEQDAFIVRKKDKDDKRAYKLSLTEQGRNIAKTIDEFSKNLFEIITKDISQEELDFFYKIFQKIAANSTSNKLPNPVF